MIITTSDELPERALAPHYVIWIRPSRSIMPWTLLSCRDGKARVFRDVRAADEAAHIATDMGGCCSVVATMLLPVESSPDLFAVLSAGSRIEALDE